MTVFRHRSAILRKSYKFKVFFFFFFFFFWRDSPPVDQDLLIIEVSRSHTTTHHSR